MLITASDFSGELRALTRKQGTARWKILGLHRGIHVHRNDVLPCPAIKPSPMVVLIPDTYFHLTLAFLDITCGQAKKISVDHGPCAMSNHALLVIHNDFVTS